jgi:hypothetical protein
MAAHPVEGETMSEHDPDRPAPDSPSEGQDPGTDILFPDPDPGHDILHPEQDDSDSDSDSDD